MENEELTREFMNPRHRKRILTAKWEIVIPEGEPYVIVRPRSDRTGSTHNLILRALIEALKPHIQAYTADAVEVEGLAKLKLPLRVGRHRIDLITWNGAKYEYWEVKAPYELGLSRTQEQLRDYAHHLENFNLVTTPDGERQARDIINLLGLKDKVKVWIVRPRLGEEGRKSELKAIR